MPDTFALVVIWTFTLCSWNRCKQNWNSGQECKDINLSGGTKFWKTGNQNWMNLIEFLQKIEFRECNSWLDLTWMWTKRSIAQWSETLSMLAFSRSQTTVRRFVSFASVVPTPWNEYRSNKFRLKLTIPAATGVSETILNFLGTSTMTTLLPPPF